MISASPSSGLSSLRVVLGSLNFVRTGFLKSAPGNKEIRAIHRALVLVSSSTNSFTSSLMPDRELKYGENSTVK